MVSFASRTSRRNQKRIILSGSKKNANGADESPNSSHGGGTPTRSLNSKSSNAMNKVATPPTHKSNGTIRTVPAEPLHLSTPSPLERPRSRTEEEARRSQRGDSMPHSTLRQSSTTSALSGPPLTRNNGLVRAISTEFGPTRFPSPSSLAVPAPVEDPQWSSAVGRANLGKSGRVIERLMGENDMLKRDINIEKLKAAELIESKKMIEEKSEADCADYEMKLHNAAVDKALLKRRERQLTDLRAQIQAERDIAAKALASEKGWKQALDILDEETHKKVDKAETHASLMDGRCRVMESHWESQKALLKEQMTAMSKVISDIVEERRKDDERMNMLQRLCEQQHEELAKLRAEKEGIGEMFEKYKVAQNEGLATMVAKLKAQEQQTVAMVEESTKLRDELRWAMAVNRDVRPATPPRR